jgi:hypothetical protein
MKRRALLLLLVYGPGLHGVENNAVAARLAKVRRLYVEPLTGGGVATQMRDMLIAALENSGLYTLTEDPTRADAMLRGSADEQVFKETHTTSDSVGVNARANRGASSHALSAGTSSYDGIGVDANQHESSHIEEHRREATASVRLVDAEGDVIWSTTQESAGAKFRGAMADVADKVARNLIEQTRRVRGAKGP